MRDLKTILIAVLISLTNCNSNHKTNVSDGFESNTLKSVWTTDKFVSGAVEIQSNIVRSGKSSIKITLRPGDQIQKEKGTIQERAELLESEKLRSPENSFNSYSFSLFIPQDFPIVSTRLVIAQWKQDCESGNCNQDSPVLALRYQSGDFRITLQTDSNRMTLYDQTEDIRNRWLDFKFNIRFSRNQTGKVLGWMNDKAIIDYSGVTAYPETRGYPVPSIFYFKVGLYRNQMDLPMTIYIDDYKKELLSK